MRLLLIPLLATLLVTAQAVWTTAVKRNDIFQGSPADVAKNLVSNGKIWLGGFIYLVATVLYLSLLSKLPFFSVQVGMTATAVVFSTILSALIFREHLTAMNLIGAALVVVGLPFVLLR